MEAARIPTLTSMTLQYIGSAMTPANQKAASALVLRLLGRLYLTGLVGVNEHRNNVGNSYDTGETGAIIPKQVSQIIATAGRKSSQSS